MSKEEETRIILGSEKYLDFNTIILKDMAISLAIIADNLKDSYYEATKEAAERM